MAFHFIHLADVHLDTPFQSRNAQLRSWLRDSIRMAFAAAVDLALERQVDALLIAGDLFDSTTLSFATERFLLQQFVRLEQAGVAVYYAPGNHDPCGSGSRLGQISWPDNLHLFTSQTPEIFLVHNRSGQLVASVTGAGHESARVGKNLALSFPPAASDYPAVALLHTLVVGSQGAEVHERYAPCNTGDLTGKGYCYWALGHIHGRSQILDSPLAIYAGNLVGRHPAEQGQGGVYDVVIDDSQRVKASFCPLAPLSWLTLNLNISPEVEDLTLLEEELITAIAGQLEQSDYPVELLLRVRLAGISPLYRELQNQDNLETLAGEIGDRLHLKSLELVTDLLVRQLDPDRYRGEPDLLGSVLQLIEQLEGDDRLLLQLAPERLAGCSRGSESEKLTYLRGLLAGLDLESIARMVEED